MEDNNYIDLNEENYRLLTMATSISKYIKDKDLFQYRNIVGVNKEYDNDYEFVVKIFSVLYQKDTLLLLLKESIMCDADEYAEILLSGETNIESYAKLLCEASELIYMFNNFI